jgi:hypothetical protein
MLRRRRDGYEPDAFGEDAEQVLLDRIAAGSEVSRRARVHTVLAALLCRPRFEWVVEISKQTRTRLGTFQNGWEHLFVLFRPTAAVEVLLCCTNCA